MKKIRKYPQKLFLAYSAVFLAVLFFIFSATLTILYREQYAFNVDTQAQLVSKTEEQIDASLQSMDRIVNGLLFNKSFMSIIKDPDFASHYTDYSKQVLNVFVSLDAPSFPTHRIIAFNDDAYYNLSKTGENQEYIKQSLSGYPWKDEILAKDGEKVVLPLHADSFEPAAYPVYSVARAITDGKVNYGIIEVQNSYEHLEALCTLDSHVGRIALFAPTGEQIYPAEENELLPALYKQASRQSGLAQGRFRYQSHQVCYSVSAYSGWVTLLYTPVSDIFPFAVPLILACIAAFLLLSGGALFIIRIISKRLTAPLVNLNQALKKVSIDNLSIELPTQYGVEEIESINQSFLTMFSQLKEAIARSVQARANEERANYLALQSQMNPHTLYNTIGMIESVSYINGDKEVSNLCVCFSEMLRYISDFTKREYTVCDELQHLSNYATLTETRYHGKLEIYTQVDDSLKNKVIPKFTIQPLVENAVKHGFEGAHKHLTVWVRVATRPGGWSLQVIDDGIGFSQDKLDEIERQFLHCERCLHDKNDVVNMKIGNLALSNIYIRCRILYGDAFAFHVSNAAEGTGGCVELLIGEETCVYDENLFG